MRYGNPAEPHLSYWHRHLTAIDFHIQTPGQVKREKIVCLYAYLSTLWSCFRSRLVENAVELPSRG